MSNIRNTEEFIKDLQLIKEAAQKNNSILRKVSLTEGLKYTILLTGVLIIVVCSGILFLENYYGSYDAIPSTLKQVIYVFIGLCTAGLVFKKIRDIMKFLRRYEQEINVIRLFNELYNRKFWPAIYPFITSIIIFTVYFSISGIAHLIVPVMVILISLLFFNIQHVVNMKETVAPSQWILLSGLLSLFFAGKWNTLVILMVTLGIGLIFIFISVQIASSKEKRKQVG